MIRSAAVPCHSLATASRRVHVFEETPLGCDIDNGYVQSTSSFIFFSAASCSNRVNPLLVEN